jgi:hypothetical protein
VFGGERVAVLIETPSAALTVDVIIENVSGGIQWYRAY